MTRSIWTKQISLSNDRRRKNNENKILHYIFKVESTIECASSTDAIDKIENATIGHLDDSEITNIDVVEGL